MARSRTVQASRRTLGAASHVWWVLASALLERARFGRGSGLWRALYLLVSLPRLAAPVRVCGGRSADGGPLSLAVAGTGGLAAEVAAALFGSPVEDRPGGRARLDRPRTINAGADLEAALVHPWRVQRWTRAGWTLVPRHVRFELDLTRPWAPQAGRHGRSLVRELRKVARASFDVEEVPARDALRDFRARMVAPYARRRFGRNAGLWIGRRARRGTILFLVRDRVRLAGILLVPLRSRLVLVRLGVLDGRLDLVREGVLAAAYLHAIRWAGRRGFRIVDGGVSSGLARDGTHRWKRKWGFVPKETTFADRIALRARTEAGRRALRGLATPDAGAADRDRDPARARA